MLEAAGIEVVALAGDLDELMRKVARAQAGPRGGRHPDAADAHRRGAGGGPPHAAELPGTGVLVLSQYLDEDYVFTLLGDGTEGVGYLLKDRLTDGDRFVDAARRVAAGESALDPEVVAHLLGRRRAASSPLDDLTERERTVLEEMAEGRSNAAIAAAHVPVRPRRRAPRERDLLQARAAGHRATRTGACWPCSPTCAPEPRRSCRARCRRPRARARRSPPRRCAR